MTRRTSTCPTCGSSDVRWLIVTTPARPELHRALRCWTCDGGWEMDGRKLIDELELEL
jgi:formate dehydrogenase maturation protein FdhE